jgi:hypothetical protein
MTTRRIMQIQRGLFAFFALCAAVALSPRACAQVTWSTIDQGGGFVWSTSYVEVDTSDYDAGAGVMAEMLDPDGNVITSNSQFTVTPDCDGEGGEWAEVDLYSEAGLSGWYSVFATYWELGFPDIADGDWTYLGDETEWTYTGGAGLGISFLGQTSVDYGQGGYLAIFGSGFAPNGTPNVAWVSFGTSFTVANDYEIDVPIDPATPIGLYIILVLIENGESTNSQTFSVTGDQTPSGISVSPSPWVAGAMYEIQITGLNFGTNQPQVSFSCGIGTCLDNTFSPDSWSDTLITGMVDVDPNAAGQTVTVTVGSTGYGGFSFVPGPGQTSQGSTTVPVTGCAVAQQNQIIQEYVTYGVGWRPVCSYFTQTAHSQYYSATQLGNIGQQPYLWALVKYPLTVSYIEGYGLDAWTYLIGATQTINSTYRPPAYNQQIGGAVTSRHQFGDAVDIANLSHSQPEHDTKACWASIQAAIAAGVVSCSNGQDAGADWVEPLLVGGCGYNCIHADWRNHDYNQYSQ